MKLRSQLVFVLFLVAVLPLTAVVLYNYASSQRAVRRAVEQEAAQLTEEMSARMAQVEGELLLRMEQVGELARWQALRASGESLSEEERAELSRRAVRTLGDAAPLVASLSFVPLPEPAPSPPGAAAAGVAVGPEVPGEVQIEIDVPQLMIEIEAELRTAIESAELNAEAKPWLVVVDQLLNAAAVGAAQAAAAGKRQEHGSVAPPAPPAPSTAADRAVEREALARHLEAQRQAARSTPSTTTVRSARELKVPVLRGERLVGEVQSELQISQLLHRVLARTRRDQGEIPFAVDADGELYTLEDADREALERLPLAGPGSTEQRRAAKGWVIVREEDADSGVTFGIARPIRESLAAVDRTAARNLAGGLGLIVLGLAGLLPLSRRLTRDLQKLTTGAQLIARGHLSARVAVRGRTEVAQVASAFNQMAADVEAHQQRLVEEEKRRHEQEVRQELLRAEVERQRQELEEARRFQLSLLPQQLPQDPAFELAVSMTTATEVGGDYYDFHHQPGMLLAAVGDATGHGARAGTMVTAIKALFTAAPVEVSPGAFLTEAAAAVRRMELGRMGMALLVARLVDRRLEVATAGMPPLLIHRAVSGEIEEVELPGMPLGGLETAYREVRLELAAGDTILMMSDGLPELPDAGGEPLGYSRAQAAFSAAAGSEPEEIVAALKAAAQRWAGDGPPADDMTFVALRVR
jgi:serine phosphatase RsbU (regulator of sigma subunit)